MYEEMLRYMPLRNLVTFGNGQVSIEDVEEAIRKLNGLPS